MAAIDEVSCHNGVLPVTDIAACGFDTVAVSGGYAFRCRQDSALLKFHSDLPPAQAFAITSDRFAFIRTPIFHATHAASRLTSGLIPVPWRAPRTHPGRAETPWSATPTSLCWVGETLLVGSSAGPILIHSQAGGTTLTTRGNSHRGWVRQTPPALHLHACSWTERSGCILTPTGVEHCARCGPHRQRQRGWDCQDLGDERCRTSYPPALQSYAHAALR